MTRFRRITVAILAAAVLAATSVACGSSDTDKSDSGQADGSTIKIGMLDQLVPEFKKYAAAYEKKFPSRKVEIVTLPAATWTQNLITAKLGGELPDIFFNVPSTMNQLDASKVSRDISGLLADGAGGLKNNFLPQFLGQWHPFSDPKAIHGLPVSADSTVLYYNRSLFAKAGVTDLPNDGWTWEHMVKVAKQITDKGKGKYVGLASPSTSLGAAIYTPMIAAFGGSVYDAKTNKSGIGEPAAIRAWKTLLQPELDGATGPINLTTLPKFEAGQTAMILQTRPVLVSFKAQLKDDWDIAQIPTVNGKRPVGGGAYGLSVATSSKNLAADAAFLGWFYSLDGGMAIAQQSGAVIPATTEGVAKGTWRDVPPPPAHFVAVSEASAKDAILEDLLPGKAQATLAEAITEAIQEVLIKHKSIDDTFRAAQSTVNDALEQEK